MFLRLLIIDDGEDDARRIVHEVQRGGYEVAWERVETAPALAAAVQQGAWNVVICEWQVPHCSRATVLATLDEHAVDVPVIIVSGQVDDALGVTAIKDSVRDFVNKRQLARLCPAIARELRSAAALRASRSNRGLPLDTELTSQLREAVILIRTSDRRIVFTNPRFDQMFGYARGELLGKHVSIVNAPTDKSPEETAGEISAALLRDERWEGEVCNRRKDGSHFWCQASASTFEHPHFGTVWLSVHHDITSRKVAEEALRESEERFKTIFEEAPLGVALIDSLTGEFCEVNARYAAIAGRTREELARSDWMSITHPDDVQQDLDNMALLNAGKIPGFGMSKRYIRPDGSCVWVQLTVARVTVADGRHPRHLAMIEDITERKQLHEQILRAKSFLDSIVENIPNMVFVKDAKTLTFTLFNRAGEELLGYRRADLVGKSDYDFFPKEEADFFTERDRLVLREKILVDIPEEPIETAQRGRRILHTKKIPILDETGEPAYLLGISEDITELKYAREQLRVHEAELAHVLRLHTLGGVAAEIAHEINQPMSAIANYAQGCRRLITSGATTPEELLPAIEEIAFQALRAGEILRRLRQRVQKQATRHEPEDLNAVVSNAVRVLAPQAEHLGIPILVELASNLPRVLMDRIQIEQVVLNLMLNAIEAMQTGGAAEPELLVRTAAPGNGTVEVSVRDRGIGLAPTVSDRMFEPFYTSKPKGLGMGLSISRSIVVEGHGGQLWGSNNAAGGATFHLALPIASPNPNGTA